MPGRGFPGAVLSRLLGIRARLSAAHTHPCVCVAGLCKLLYARESSL